MGNFEKEYFDDIDNGEDNSFLGGRKYDEWGEEEDRASDLIRGIEHRLKDDYEE